MERGHIGYSLQIRIIEFLGSSPIFVVRVSSNLANAMNQLWGEVGGQQWGGGGTTAATGPLGSDR